MTLSKKVYQKKEDLQENHEKYYDIKARKSTIDSVIKAKPNISFSKYSKHCSLMLNISDKSL